MDSISQKDNKMEEESGITMVDVLQEEEELEDDAEAVLGPGDDDSCTYAQGYLKRQALYSCLTCCPVSSEKHGGFCLACSYHCHEGHELIELYTKRNFKCDCGNSNFPEDNPCKLFKEKTHINNENKYNQNFAGKYCTCSRPYPDPDDTIDDQMIQCIVCEDWYHGRHLELESTPTEDNFSEMICHLCSVKIPFMKYYRGYTVNPVSSEESKGNISVDSISPEKVQDNHAETKEASFEKSTDEEPFKADLPENCRLRKLRTFSCESSALFLTESCRKELCRCSACKEMYCDLHISFLINEEDTVSSYEAEGRAKRVSNRGVQRELDALSSLDRVTRTEVVHGFNTMSSSLREYLRKFAENGKTVRGEDIKEFFSEMTAKKKQKTLGVQHFCK